jgi:hypothetical protein
MRRPPLTAAVVRGLGTVLAVGCRCCGPASDDPDQIESQLGRRGNGDWQRASEYVHALVAWHQRKERWRD